MWAVLTTLFMIVLFFSLPTQFVVVISLIVSLTGLIRSRGRLLLISYQNNYLSVVSLVGVLGVSVPLIASIRMGLGDYPHVFFGMDTPSFS